MSSKQAEELRVDIIKKVRMNSVKSIHRSWQRRFEWPFIEDYDRKTNLKIEKFYMDNFSKVLDEYLKDEDIIDLRAGFYEKFYKIEKPYTTMKFIKDGKVVSHWAKAYRGIILKLLAQNSVKTIDELMNMEVQNLRIEEIKKQKIKTEIVYSII